ncbi:MAG: efflux RND transporter periplasmic adaptor subunit [Armatimonadota bacterium]|nr:efflux RND transporter periplasmic adaptor subunit [Armatimonadota bacterium]MDR7450880.1 efflux RND transporter periplasmic adaptor subunit [Armatimonadota bacterium]MDR7465802.1 efflux RND transporter periplasmic adaptor subunit [Armatimonadota bacterium]MDR7493710.1 efflux RND transporter periplasmic adaptor subunit [Armatimonadota bacterium]MDR7500568.1 efflux RND transporter periplasmic adaptor subunit [Armatimonadota bacterium]
MKQRSVVAVVVVLAVAGAVFAAVRDRERAETPRYRTAEVTRGDLVVSVSASGSVLAASLVEVKSRATGEVRSVFVREGDQVRRGQVLVEIDDPDARAAVATARAALAAAQARVEQTEAAVASQRANTAAAIRQAQAGVEAARARLQQQMRGRPEEIRQAEEALAQARAAESLARQNLARQQQLFAEGYLPRSALDQAQNQYDVAVSQRRAAEARAAQVRAGGSAEDIAVARAQLRQAEAQLAEARNGELVVRQREADAVAARAQLRQAAADLVQAQERLAEGRITAPIDGVVVKLSVQVGQSVIGTATGGTPVLTLAQLSPVLAQVMVDESDIARLTPAAAVELTADALPDVTFRGKIDRITPQPVVNQNVTQYAVIVEVTDPRRQLGLGMTVDAEFILARRAGVLLVPQEAVRGKESKAVFVVEGTKLVPRVVGTGLSDGRFVEITSGLREGELVYLGTARAQPTTPSAPGGSPFQPRFVPRR